MSKSLQRTAREQHLPPEKVEGPTNATEDRFEVMEALNQGRDSERDKFGKGPKLQDNQLPADRTHGKHNESGVPGAFRKDRNSGNDISDEEKREIEALTFQDGAGNKPHTSNEG